MREIVYILFVFCWLNGLAQETSVLPEVTLTESKNALIKAGHTQKQLRDTLIPGSFSGNIGDIIESSHSTHVRSYGPGLLSTYSSRGSSSSQVGVFWNDIPLNSPGLGSTDLSLVPANLFGGNITNGGNSALFGSQVIGSVLSIEETGTNSNNLVLGGALGSFDNYSLFAKGQFRVGRISSFTAINYLDGKNDYPFEYRDEIYYRENAAQKSTNIMQTFKYFNYKGLNAKLSFWYVNSDRESPNSIIVAKPGEAKLFNEKYRTSLSVRQKIGNSFIKLTQAVLLENQDYSDPTVDLYSFNDTRSSITKLFAGHKINEYLVVTEGIDYIWNEATGSSKDSAQQNSLGFYATAQFTKKKIGLILSARQEVIDGNTMPFSPKFSLEYKVYPRFSLVGNIGYSFRYPSLNDRYWIPGGNPNLKPEEGWGGEAGVKWTNGFIDFKVVYFDGLLNNYIQWVPGQGGVWSPQNVKQVRSRGAETFVKYKAQLNVHKLYFMLGYTYTDATVWDSDIKNDQSVGKQLIYTPMHKFTGNLSYAIGRFNIVYLLIYTGEVNANSDHATIGYINSYTIHNAEVSYSFGIKKIGIKWHIAFKNFTNQTYETIRFYPMPGINFQTGITINI